MDTGRYRLGTRSLGGFEVTRVWRVMRCGVLEMGKRGVGGFRGEREDRGGSWRRGCEEEGDALKGRVNY